MKKTLTALAATALLLTACGGAGKAKSTSSGNAADAQVIADLKFSNMDFLPNSRPVGTWRWMGTPKQHVLVYIPAPAVGNATEQDYASKVQNAIAEINAKLNGELVMAFVISPPTDGRNYIHVSYGTSYVPSGSTDYTSHCANVATGPSLGDAIQPDSQNGIASNPVYLNLGNGLCDVTQDIVTHEFGHALGLAFHFHGFGGDGPSVSAAYWDALSTLYGNPQSTTQGNLIVRRAAH